MQSLSIVQLSEQLIQTRTTLLHRLKNWQDQSSWQEFFDNYWRLIYGVARKAGLNDAEAQDVVQETMISLAKNMPAFKYNRDAGSFKGWLLKLTRWRIVDQQRKRRHAASNSPNGEEITASGGSTDLAGQGLNDLWEDEWKIALLEAAITNVRRRLNPRQYQIFDFYVNKNWVAKKVAEKFGVSMDQVYVAKYRITEMIQAEVERLQREAT
jgi:RNA polymerase sigma factor (sigma-70 family)